MDNSLSKEEQLEAALNTLKNYVEMLALKAGESKEYGEKLWDRIRRSGGVLQELAYYHDYGNFLCKHEVAGYTIADILVWQVDHFKAYMDRPEDMNRYRQERLLLTAFDIMLQMEENPEPFKEKMVNETGTDFVDKFS
ncbi:MAG: hypothetical protein NC094_06505 [Bacteroidales bacterium]|nr:hypothetical protein [Lachnoclostridium sp.]MCM1384803.1 hypothetical protein [Lachnoclostridium sp.]MCM1465053.1 hypothetical protein [Bacteroidales bacterium]